MKLRITSYALRIAIQDAAVSLLAYLADFRFTQLVHGAASHIGALWSMISGLVVLQATRRETVATAWLRVLGTIFGAVISAAYLYLLPFSPLGMAVCIGLTVLLCHTFRVPDHARLAAITVAVIMGVSQSDPSINPLMNATLRFVESGIGTVLATLAVVLWPDRERE